MEIQVYNQEAQTKGTVAARDEVFSAPLNRDLLYQVVTAQAANQRQVIAHTKGRSEVHGGGKKPWRQKGTGRARHGSIRSPLWKGGGVTFGPTNQKNYSRKVNTTMARKALATALSSKMADGTLVVVDDIVLRKPKTKEAVVVLEHVRKLFKKIKPASRMLIVVPEANSFQALRRAMSNILQVDVIPAGELNALSALSYPYLVLLKNSVAVLEHRIVRT